MTRRPWELISRNWPIKLAAVFLAVVLWVVVASEEPTTQVFAVRLTLDVPAGRTLTQPLPTVSALVTGSGREVLKLHAAPPEIRKPIPDTISATIYTIQLQPTDVILPQGAKVSVQDLQPRQVELALDAVARRDVPIVARVSVRPDSGYALQGGLAVSPSLARIVGSEAAVALVDTVFTVPLELVQVTAPFQRPVPVDTGLLGRLRVYPKTVEVSGVVSALSERVFQDVPVRAPGRAFRNFVVSPERVLVTVRGAAARVLALTADSIRVAVELQGAAVDGARARLVVLPPPGVNARVLPDSVTLRRRSPRG